MNLFKSALSKQTEILKYCPTATLLISEDGSVIFSNAQAQAIFVTEDIDTKNILELTGLNVETILDTKRQKSIAKISTPQNEEKILELRASRLANEPTFMITVEDITTSHSMIQNFLNDAEQKEQTSQQKNIFLVKMSNNLKSPLHSVIGFSQAILEGLGGDINDKQEKYLRIIHKNSTELLALLEKLLELSEVESSDFDASCKSFDILNATNNSLNELKVKIIEKQLKLNIDTKGLLKKTCYSDEEVLKHIIKNLTENAVNSCDIGSITIKLSNPELDLVQEKDLVTDETTTQTSFLQVDVIDTGAGLQSNEINDIFDPYVQVDKNTKKNLLKGLILGITKKLVENLNGKIWVESELMKESKFSFIIPIDKKNEFDPAIIQTVEEQEKPAAEEIDSNSEVEG